MCSNTMSGYELSRRTFVKTTAASAAGSLIMGVSRLESGAIERVQQANPDDLARLSLTEASELVRRRRVSPVELTKACLARIEQLNPALNAFITVTSDSSLAQARQAENEIRQGKWRGPLHGIPIALKDLFDTAGIKTTAGSALFKDRLPTEDAEVVRRLKAAGTVLLGKTNMVEFAYGGNAAVSYFGAVHNPWSFDRNPGGSSSGSAAAIAARLCYGALGSDTAGSVRQPASFCGIVGLKPTFGLVSTRGVIPLSWSCDHVGPMTRTVEDSALMLQAIGGYDPADTNSVRMNMPDYRAALRHPTSALRVGVPRDFFFDDLDPEFDAAMKKALAVVETITAGVKSVVLPSPASKQESVRTAVRAAEAYLYHYEWVNGTPELYQPETLVRVRSGADVTALAYIQGRRDLAEARRVIEQIFETIDVLVTPTTPVPPPTIAEISKDVSTSIRLGAPYIRNTSPFDVYGIPTISVPCGFTTNGLPIGMQISGPNGGEAVVFRLAAAYERATEWHKRLPDVSRTVR
jgi:aspartyl-tRNA(Asn)/glutamyl-tRNA(Gln) amidotransferase subunit A